MSGIKLSPKYGVNPTIPVCFWCGKEKNEIALMGHVGDGRKHEDFEMPMHAIINYEPCEECAKAMASGFTVMESTETPNWVTNKEIQNGVYPTGKWVVLKHEAAHRIFTELDDSADKAFLDASVFDKMFGDIREVS